MLDYRKICFCEKYGRIDCSDVLSVENQGIILAVLHNGDVQIKTPDSPPLEIAQDTAFVCPCPCTITVISNTATLTYLHLYGYATTLYCGVHSSPSKIGDTAYIYYSQKICQSVDIIPLENAAAVSTLCYHLICDLSNERNFTSADYPPLVTEALRVIEQDFALLYGVQELSEALNVSKEHLVRVFSAAYSTTPGKHLTKTKIKAAKRLLQNREFNIEMVASLCGFSTSNYFCKVFRQHTGQSPAQYRQFTTQTVSSKSDVAKLLDSWYL